jgi:hypothetical protein
MLYYSMKQLRCHKYKVYKKWVSSIELSIIKVPFIDLPSEYCNFHVRNILENNKFGILYSLIIRMENNIKKQVTKK